MATHDARNVVSVFAGIPLSAGYAMEEYLTIEATNDWWTIQKGSTGEGGWNRNNDFQGKATVKESGYSLINDALSTIMELDRLASAGVGPFMAKDLNSLSFAMSPEARIIKPPTLSYSGTELPDREWPIGLFDVEMFVGGQLV
jgi:hypothetical protein